MLYAPLLPTRQQHKLEQQGLTLGWTHCIRAAVPPHLPQGCETVTSHFFSHFFHHFTIHSLLALAGGAANEGRTWQPYTDALVGAALMALPWGGAELLAGGGGAELDRLWASVAAYMVARPRASQPGLAPFFAANGPEDAAAQCAHCRARCVTALPHDRIG